jgi:hypothetical protein
VNGDDNNILADIHRFDFLREQWSRVIMVRGVSVGERWGHAMTYYRHRLYITGGRDKHGMIIPGVTVLAIRQQTLPYKRDDVSERDKDVSIGLTTSDDTVSSSTSLSSVTPNRSITGGIWYASQYSCSFVIHSHVIGLDY